MTTTTTPFERLGELYTQTLCQDAYYEGAAGTIRDAVLGSVAWLADKSIDLNDAITAAQKLTHDAMGFLDCTIGLIDTDWLENRCDWKRIDSFFDKQLDQNELGWVIEQLDEQQQRVWKIYFEHAGAPGRHLADGEPALGIRWHHDLALAATFLQAAGLILQEIKLQDSTNG